MLEVTEKNILDNGGGKERRVLITTKDRAFYIFSDDLLAMKNKSKWLVQADACRYTSDIVHPEDELIGWSTKWIKEELPKTFSLFLEKGERESTMVILPEARPLPKLYLLRRKLWKTIAETLFRPDQSTKRREKKK